MSLNWYAMKFLWIVYPMWSFKKIANKSKILDNFSNKCTQFLDFLIVIKYFNSVIH